MREFQKILIANRGEIAIRVMRAANEMGKKTVAVYAEEDKLGLHRFKADEAYKIGEGMGPVAAYLSINEIIRVARESGADAIHPGYGLLSENPDFVDACEANGITFIGPKAATMRALGDKASARKVAIEAGVPVIPATEVLGDDMVAIAKEAEEIGYPLMLKASWGGGGRGMRPIHGPDELEEKVLEGRREAEAAFGNGEGYLEKMITRARHVEVQILGDSHGEIYHLWERDCSVQRRNQKVVERAPAPYLTEEQRNEICELGRKICAHVNYECAGTVEFLMDMNSGKFYFIEVNPRVQVEHTVTEEVTGIDIVQAQIRIAEGKTLAEATGKASQDEIRLNGHALQTRITTEDPQNNFIPDYGRITAYRSATGMGIRLDGGTAYAGGVITRYYDSLLVKITAHAQTPQAAIARMDRALREFRIRGVSTNIAFVENLLKHPTFLSNEYTTKFIDETPDLFNFKKRRDRGTKVLTYIADITVNGHPETEGRAAPADGLKAPKAPAHGTEIPAGTRNLLEEKGAKAVADWMLDQKKLLLTDTTMRDGHQSLLATRMRSIDMIKAAPAYASNLSDLFSVECWGGATFDVAYRFLQECPWQRLRDLRAAMPNVLTQMLLRASNGVGYTNYPDNVVREFVRQAAETGVDVFRVFDSLNWVENMRVAMDAVNESGKIVEGTVCYTGDILNPDRAKYDLKYYVGMAKELEAAGAHILGLKDMAGLLKPASATALVKALKDEISIPVHFHTHDTSGIAGATILAASAAGVDAVDAAMDSFSGGTSQPCLGSIVEALRHTDRDTGLSIEAIREINDYWEHVRGQYVAFESGLASPASEVYLHEMPGGQFTNLKAQARSLGLEERWPEVAQSYADVNQMFGDIVKVTPSSKVVGDMALMMVSQGLSRAEVEDPDHDMAFPDSVVDMMRGNLGQPPGGFPDGIVKKVLKDEAPNLERPGAHLEPIDLEATRAELSKELEGFKVDDEDLNGYLMYPKVFLDYMGRHRTYGPVRTLPTKTFFYGMEPGEEIEAEIDPGKTLEILLQAVGETDENGEVKVFFELNGQPRVIRVPNRLVKATTASRPKAEEGNANHVGAPMPGVVASVAVSAGQEVHEGDLLLTIEAMKMETGIHAERDATVKAVHVSAGGQIDAKDLLVELE
ncbi:2-oxoglutarate carboxylase small subunit [Aliiroseovarius sp. xm-m-379]|uniref:pyruvate carboxylase n=1 Tax=unclassified Aliiroseovarius TaxID=2623558 RepID=UPI001568E7D8|nr:MULTISPECIES: pyruvate carboxylase [unclassified Aliiroseovarius]NRP12576.1 2-oxoglutarate carboxylase small subunit [Aliiroseovarius sp. xm-d-517]NRP26237.1 2-oxoglutarate carboxylase small subunit [Aliiroseovarius sp. xm-m-379]NRP31804.1 2-oxoglutarate carboxylase small subunit [Aliiroseovarius sp. xm-m-314]NRP35036.1 2-oxoglutarate carboxylase small subunit [Aliiroseovarius sp. xm-a-104]NRP42529.1 2-oxoglutarate carboxylase small subunit [Aliiroseovarius sp. xm-m-339-2]